MRKKAAASVALLLVGGFIYVSMRTDRLLLFRVADILRLGTIVDILRLNPAKWPDFFVYNLPGGLWAASYVILVDLFAAKRSRHSRLLWSSAIPLTGVVSEAMQSWGLLPGTADALDAVCYAAPLLIYAIHTVIKQYRNKTIIPT